MKKIYLNRKLFSIHSWLGLFLGICYLLISMGGASIVFSTELKQLLYGNKIKIGNTFSGGILYDEMYSFAKTEYPNSRYIRITNDLQYPGNAYAINTSDTKPLKLFENGKGNIDYLNPYTAQVIFSTKNNGIGDIPGFLNNLHQSLNFGTGGAFSVVVISIAMLLSIITGFIFYRKSILKILLFKKGIRYNNWRTASSDLHRVIGTWAFIFNLCIFSSGFYMQYVYLTPAWWKNNWPPKKHEVILPKIVPPISSIVIKAKESLPNMTVNTVTIAHDGSETITISGVTGDKLFMNVDNFASVSFSFEGILKEKYHKKWDKLTGAEKFGIINFNLLHSGRALGTFGKILWMLLGFAPAFLSITGFLFWWRKARRPQRKNS